MSYVNSENIKMYPSSKRQYSNEGDKVIVNPESRLNTEVNLTLPISKPYANKGTFVIPRDNLNELEFFIEGYYFKLTSDGINQVTSQSTTSKVFAYIRIGDVSSEDTSFTELKELMSLDNGATVSSDLDVGGEFHGIGFADTEPSGYTASLLILEKDANANWGIPASSSTKVMLSEVDGTGDLDPEQKSTNADKKIITKELQVVELLNLDLFSPSASNTPKLQNRKNSDAFIMQNGSADFTSLTIHPSYDASASSFVSYGSNTVLSSGSYALGVNESFKLVPINLSYSMSSATQPLVNGDNVIVNVNQTSFGKISAIAKTINLTQKTNSSSQGIQGVLNWNGSDIDLGLGSNSTPTFNTIALNNLSAGYALGIDASTKQLVNLSLSSAASVSNNWGASYSVKLVNGFAQTSDGKVSVTYENVPQATGDSFGVVRLGFSSSDANRQYAVESSSTGKLFVSVPWISYLAGTGISLSKRSGNNYIDLKTASSNEIGGIKTGTTVSGSTYYVGVTSNGVGYVNVPWSDHQYDAGTGLSLATSTFNLKTATSSEIGGIKVGYSPNGRNYAVNLNSSNEAFVSVPWIEYTNGEGLSLNNSTHAFSVNAATSSTFGGVKISIDGNTCTIII